MYKDRLLTISILLPLFAWLIFYASTEIFLSAVTTIIIIAVLEWLHLLKSYSKSFINKAFYNVFYLSILFIICLLIIKSCWLDPFIINKIMLLSACFWGIAFLQIIFYRSADTRANNFWINNFKLLYNYLSCLFAIIPSWLAINYMYIYNKNLLVLCCLIIIAADIGAYIAGKLFGRHKLSAISPRKTWEGVIGGCLSALTTIAIYILAFNKLDVSRYINQIIIISIITIITALSSVVGDLFASLLKRTVGAKDSGNLLPGHGGVLDRLDSFCAGVPIFLIIALLYKL